MGFVSSSQYGLSGEKFVLKLLERHGYTAKLNDVKENRSFYDIVMDLSPKKKIYIECKFDKMCAQTGNLAIEYFNPKSGKDSGVNITKAQIWSHTILDHGNPTVWFASVKQLKKFLEVTTPHKIIAKGGDNNASLYLYKEADILPVIFNRMENLQEESAFHDIIKKLVKEK